MSYDNYKSTLNKLLEEGDVMRLYHFANGALINSERLEKENEALSSRLSDAEGLLTEAHDLMDDVHCYETDVYKAISKYFNGDEEDE